MARTFIQSVMVGLGLISLFFSAHSCAVNPVSGGRELMLVSEEDEIKLGQQTDVQIKREYGVYEDARLTAYVDEICQRLGKVSHRPNLNYHFKIVDASVVNAFAVPGGYVYFTRGILANLNNEAELATVMGHEIGHITARHSAQQLSRAQLAQLGLGVGGIFLPDLVSGLAQFGVGMLFLSFSRDNERQADALGVEYASRGGYDGAQMANFFESLKKMNPGSDKTGLPSWFSTHPSPDEREQTVRLMAQEWQQRIGLKDPKVNRDGYLKQIDGMVYGDDPRQGYVDKGTFYHPDMRFQFPVPAGWKLNNTTSQVQMIHEGKEAAILFSLGSGKSAYEAAKGFVNKSGAVVLQSGSVNVNGLSSHRLVSEVRTQGGLYRVLSYFIEKDQQVCVFHGLTSRNLFSKYDGVFEGTMRQFRDLSDPRRINVKPDRVRVKPARKPDTVENTLRSLGVPKNDLKETALMNGMDLNDRVGANDLIKVLERGEKFEK
jgi:predicted Zn-dependent protease